MNHSILSRLGAAPLALAIALALLVGTVILAVGSAEASEHKTFEVSIDPTEITAGEPTQIVFTFENTSANPIRLRAVRITIPDGVTVLGESGSIVRNLNLAQNASTELAFEVTAACSETAYEWPVEGAQANNFNNDDNRFILVGGNPVLEVPCTNGDDLPDTVTETKTCTGSEPCELELELGNTAVKLTAGRNARLFLSLSDPSTVDMACGDGDFDKSAAILFDVRGGSQISKYVEITLSDVAPDDDFEVCFGADRRFDGAEWDDSSGFWVGIIGMCGDDSPNGRPFPGTKQGKPAPCVVSIEAGEEDNTVVIVVWSPPGDPLIRIG